MVNPKTGRCINKPKEKTHKNRGRPRKFDKPEEPKEKPTEKPSADKPEKECPPGKIVDPKTGRCINKPKEKTNKNRVGQRKLLHHHQIPCHPTIRNHHRKNLL